MRGGRWLVLALFSVSSAWGSSIWDLKRSVGGYREDAARTEVERLLWQARESSSTPSLERNFERAARAVLELIDKDGLLHGDLALLHGILLSRYWGREPAKACDVLARILPRQPESEFTGAAWFAYGVDLACEGRLEQATEAYMAALDVSWQPKLRSQIQVEISEVLLALGAAAEAANGFEQTARLAPTRLLKAQAYYGQASALERTGDYRGSTRVARFASEIHLSLKFYGTRDVFEVPRIGCLSGSELRFRRALGLTGAAQAAGDPDIRNGLLATAIDEWQGYLSQERADDLGRRRATRRLEQCQTSLARLRESALGDTEALIAE